MASPSLTGGRVSRRRPCTLGTAMSPLSWVPGPHLPSIHQGPPTCFVLLCLLSIPSSPAGMLHGGRCADQGADSEWTEPVLPPWAPSGVTRLTPLHRGERRLMGPMPQVSVTVAPRATSMTGLSSRKEGQLELGRMRGKKSKQKSGTWLGGWPGPSEQQALLECVRECLPSL